MAAVRLWTTHEIERAIALYLVTPFGKIHKQNQNIIALADALGRTPSSIALKLSNLAALDTSLDRKGMANYSKLDAEIWAQFRRNPKPVEQAYITNKDLQNRKNNALFEAADGYQHVPSENISAQTKRRQNQGLFRDAILASYESACAISDISDPRLLIASHIVAWKDDRENRLNPRNGICLNPLHDKAFDRHLMTFDEDLRPVYSPKLDDKSRRVLTIFAHEKLRMPDRFLPDPALLQKHRIEFDRLNPMN